MTSLAELKKRAVRLRDIYAKHENKTILAIIVVLIEHFERLETELVALKTELASLKTPKRPRRERAKP